MTPGYATFDVQNEKKQIDQEIFEVPLVSVLVPGLVLSAIEEVFWDSLVVVPYSWRIPFILRSEGSEEVFFCFRI